MLTNIKLHLNYLSIPVESLAARYNWCQCPVLGRDPAVEKRCPKASFPKLNWPHNCVVHEWCVMAWNIRLQYVELWNCTYDRSANFKFPGGKCKLTVHSDVTPYNLVRISNVSGGCFLQLRNSLKMKAAVVPQNVGKFVPHYPALDPN